MFRPENYNNDNDGFSFNQDDALNAMPSFDITNYANLQNVSNAIDEMNRQKFEARQAQISSAEDISIIRENITGIIENQKHLIDNQKDYIDNQKDIIEQLKTLNDTQQKQLQRLKEIFYSVEDSTSVNKEVMAELEKLLEQQPDWKAFIVDKGTDFVIGGILAAMPMLLTHFGIVL